MVGLGGAAWLEGVCGVTPGQGGSFALVSDYLEQLEKSVFGFHIHSDSCERQYYKWTTKKYVYLPSPNPQERPMAQNRLWNPPDLGLKPQLWSSPLWFLWQIPSALQFLVSPSVKWWVGLKEGK